MSVATSAIAWERLLEELPSPVAVLDALGEPLFLNRAARAVLGEAPRWLDADGSEPDPGRLPWACAARGERVAGVELGLAGQARRWLVVEAVPILFGERAAALATFSDAGRRRAAERELSLSERLLAHIFLASPIAMSFTRLSDGAILRANDKMLELLGYRREELLAGRSIFWMDEEQRRRVFERLRAGRAVRAIEVKLKRKDGQPRVVLGSLEPVGEPDQAIAVTMFNDITERKALRHDVEELKRRYQLLVENVRDYAIFLLDESGRVASWNVGAQRLKGYSEAEVIGRHFGLFYTPRDRKRGLPRRVLQAAARKGATSVEGWRLRKDGTRFWADVHVIALRDEAGRINGFAKITRDLTERLKAREAEDLKRRDRIRQEIVATVSHELRTPVAAIRGFAETLLRGALGDAKRRREFVSIIDSHARRLGGLVENILELSALDAGSRGNPEDVELAPFLRKLMDGLKPLARKKALETRLSVPEGLAVRADRARLTQVVQNLVSNAIKYNRPKGRIEVSAVKSRGRVELSVADTGVGIPEKELPRLFQQFHRTEVGRKTASGSGLGLSIAKKIVESWRGRIWAESGPGGTVFRLTAPSAGRKS